MFPIQSLSEFISKIEKISNLTILGATIPKTVDKDFHCPLLLEQRQRFLDLEVFQTSSGQTMNLASYALRLQRKFPSPSIPAPGLPTTRDGLAHPGCCCWSIPWLMVEKMLWIGLVQ